MKKLVLYTFGILSTFLLILNSCTNEDLTFLDDLEKGAYVKFVTAPPTIMGVNTISELALVGELVDPNNTVAKYELEVSATLGGTDYGPATIGSYTSFPVNLNITVNDFATLLGVSVSDINFGDQFFFEGTVTSKDGTVYYAEMSEIDGDTFVPNGLTDITIYDLTQGYKNALQFNFTIGCPADVYDPTSIPGTYNAFSDSWGVDGTVTMTVDASDPTIIYVAGITDIEGQASQRPMIWHVDPATNNVTLDPIVICANYYGYPNMFYRGGGTIFPCAGNKFAMGLDPQILDLGGWGPQGFIFTKL